MERVEWAKAPPALRAAVTKVVARAEGRWVSALVFSLTLKKLGDRK